MEANSRNYQTRQIDRNGQPCVEIKRRVKVRRRKVKEKPIKPSNLAAAYDTPASMSEATEDESTYYSASRASCAQESMNQPVELAPPTCRLIGPIDSSITSPCTPERPLSESIFDVNFDAPCSYRSATSLEPESIPPSMYRFNEVQRPADITLGHPQQVRVRTRVKVKVKKNKEKLIKTPECLSESIEMSPRKVEEFVENIPMTVSPSPMLPESTATRRTSSPMKCAESTRMRTSYPYRDSIANKPSPPSVRENDSLSKWAASQDRICFKAKNLENRMTPDQVNAARMKVLSKVPFDDLAPEQKLEYLRIKQEATGAEWCEQGPVVERFHPPANLDEHCERLKRTSIATPRHSIHTLPSDTAIVNVRSSKLFPPAVSGSRSSFAKSRDPSRLSVGSPQVITPSSSCRKPPKLDEAAIYIPDAESRPKICTKESPAYMVLQKSLYDRKTPSYTQESACKSSAKSLYDKMETPYAKESPCKLSTNLYDRETAPCAKESPCKPSGKSFYDSEAAAYERKSPCKLSANLYDRETAPCAKESPCKPSGKSFYDSEAAAYERESPCKLSTNLYDRETAPCAKESPCRPSGKPFYDSEAAAYERESPCKLSANLYDRETAPCAKESPCKPLGKSFYDREAAAYERESPCKLSANLYDRESAAYARGSPCEPSAKSLYEKESPPCAKKSPCMQSVKSLCESMKNFSVTSHRALTPSMFTPVSSIQLCQPQRSAPITSRQTPPVGCTQKPFQKCPSPFDAYLPMVPQEKLTRLNACAELDTRPSPYLSGGFHTPRGSLPLSGNDEALGKASAYRSVHCASVPSKNVQTPSQPLSQNSPFFERSVPSSQYSTGGRFPRTPCANSERVAVPKLNVTSYSPCFSNDSVKFNTNPSKFCTTPQPSVFDNSTTSHTPTRSFYPCANTSDNSYMDDVTSKSSVRTRDGELVFVNPPPEPSIRVINSISPSLSRRTPPKSPSSELSELTQHSQQLVEEVITSALREVDGNQNEEEASGEERDQQENSHQQVTSRRQSKGDDENDAEADEEGEG